jgi:hypothetical protein
MVVAVSESPAPIPQTQQDLLMKVLSSWAARYPGIFDDHRDVLVNSLATFITQPSQDLQESIEVGLFRDGMKGAHAVFFGSSFCRLAMKFFQTEKLH